MTWDHKRNFEFLANFVKMQHTFYFLVGGIPYSEASLNPFEFVLSLDICHIGFLRSDNVIV